MIPADNNHKNDQPTNYKSEEQYKLEIIKDKLFVRFEFISLLSGANLFKCTCCSTTWVPKRHLFSES